MCAISGYQTYVEFTDFSLEEHQSCDYDYLQISTTK